ncbi:hypothetical protein IFM89_036194 [Coptis chinensis]|uniref:DDE Tnp4 domain-containing protein n=1 Tax=Coptis chinensis TaxID=261450 RepID=A0A835ITY4_9MAGN|nr:hypothetical protein IFM89_036194 [Coptis chinensis]
MSSNTPNSMDSRLLASLLPSLVSQLLIVVLSLLPNNTNNSSHPSSNLFPIISNLLTSSQIATSMSLLSPSKKRKRASTSSSPSSREDGEENDGDGGENSYCSSRVPRQDIDAFKVCFRMSSCTFEWLCGLLEPLLECRDPHGSRLNISAEIRLGIGLFRFATGSDYGDIARRFRVSESIARFCTKQLCRVLCTNFRFWIAFPNANELESVASSFEGVSGFSNCCGVIGCTRFKVVKGGHCNEENLGEESVVAQIVVDNSFRILSIVAGFRGGKCDSRVLKCSTLYRDVEEGRLLNGSSIDIEAIAVPQYLVGNEGYPLLPWLMVPFVDPVPASHEDHFNVELTKMRQPALRTFASLKNWGILNKPIEEEFKTAIACIGACSILHNALLMREDYSALSEEMGDYADHDQCSQYCPESSLEENTTVQKASTVRSALARKVQDDLNSNQPTS